MSADEYRPLSYYNTNVKDYKSTSRRTSHSRDDLYNLYDESSESEADVRPGSARRTISTISTSSVGAREPVTLCWNNLNVFVEPHRAGFIESLFKGNVMKREKPKKFQVLHSLTGIVQPGQLLAILGASGSGKSTFLNALLQSHQKGMHMQGEVLVNGQVLPNMSAVSAYVQQNDLFMGTLTVREHLQFQARLRLPSDISPKKIKERVEDVIRDLGLQDCAKTKIGVAGVIKGISGGEMKRLAFASEILSNPSLLFCDEPTSGLDSFTAASVVAVLQRLARRGKTILCTIHQPASEVYAMFDRVAFLAEGRMAFFGERKAALGFFSKLGQQCPEDYNPADYIIQLLAVTANDKESRERVRKICDTFDQSPYNNELQQNTGNALRDEDGVDDNIGVLHYRANVFVQFSLIFWRFLLNSYRNPTIALTAFIQKLVMALFIGLLYLQTQMNQVGIQNINGVYFFLLAEFTDPALFGVLTPQHQEFPLYCREHHSGLYRVSSLYLGRAASYLPLYSIDGLFLICIVYYMIGLRGGFDHFLLTCLICVLLEQTAVAAGLMFSCVTPSMPVAISIAGPILTFMYMLGGLLTNIGQLPPWLSWLQYLSYYRLGYEALEINQWAGYSNITCDKEPCIKTGEQVLSALSFNPNMLWRDCGLLVVLIVAFHFIGYIGLRWRIVRAK